MKLLIISHTAHYLCGGRLVGWGPTVKEVNWLARAFDQVTHLACLHPGPAPASALPYATDKLDFVSVSPAGGLTLRKKLRVISSAFPYLVTISKCLPEADVVQVRCPAGIALYAIIALRWVKHKPRWVKYAGNWVQTEDVPPSFVFQRWWLRKGFSGGPVTVNGRWERQPPYIFPFDNPSMTLQEVQAARELGAAKSLGRPPRLIFVGRTETAKGLHTTLQILKELRSEFRDVRLDILGDGPERGLFEQMSERLGVADNVHFLGWVPHNQVLEFLLQADFIVLPSLTEGWPKVLSEAMSYGVVPIASNVSAIPQILEETRCGAAFPPDNVSGFVEAILDIVQTPGKWKGMSQEGMRSASRFTYERYLVALDDMFMSFYGASPMKQDVIRGIRAQLDQFTSADRTVQPGDR
jgi:glycosyltransferase involved in cell wall biosynthesis